MALLKHEHRRSIYHSCKKLQYKRYIYDSAICLVSTSLEFFRQIVVILHLCAAIIKERFAKLENIVFFLSILIQAQKFHSQLMQKNFFQLFFLQDLLQTQLCPLVTERSLLATKSCFLSHQQGCEIFNKKTIASTGKKSLWIQRILLYQLRNSIDKPHNRSKIFCYFMPKDLLQKYLNLLVNRSPEACYAENK